MNFLKYLQKKIKTPVDGKAASVKKKFFLQNSQPSLK